MSKIVLVKDVVHEGVKLKVIAESGWDREWALMIENQHGIRTHWEEIFESGEAALDAGVSAIEEEGTAPFVEIEGFEHMFNDKH